MNILNQFFITTKLHEMKSSRLGMLQFQSKTLTIFAYFQRICNSVNRTTTSIIQNSSLPFRSKPFKCHHNVEMRSNCLQLTVDTVVFLSIVWVHPFVNRLHLIVGIIQWILAITLITLSNDLLKYFAYFSHENFTFRKNSDICV